MSMVSSGKESSLGVLEFLMQHILRTLSCQSLLSLNDQMTPMELILSNTEMLLKAAVAGLMRAKLADLTLAQQRLLTILR